MWLLNVDGWMGGGGGGGGGKRERDLGKSIDYLLFFCF